MTENENTTLLSAQAMADIDKWLEKYPADQRRSALLSALRIVQEDNGGWLNDELIKAVAQYLRVPEIAAFEVATFYSMYDMQPVGRHKIFVCDNISCMLRGCDKIVNHLENKLGIHVGETTKDGKFTLKTVECLAACANAPMMQIDKHYYEDLTPEKVDSILEALD